MTDLEKPKRKPRAKKPPTQTAGVSGIDAHGGMGATPIEPTKPSIDWYRLGSLPAFEMFASEQSGQSSFTEIHNWVLNRREALGDDKLYELYAKWHKAKGYWPDETPMGEVLDEA